MAGIGQYPFVMSVSQKRPRLFKKTTRRPLCSILSLGQLYTEAMFFYKN
jgi:hypothetical protein